jgi:hypothetical protein
MHEMKTRGHLGLIAAVAATGLAMAACSPSAAAPTATGRAETSGVATASAGRSPAVVATPSAADAATVALNGVYRFAITKEDVLAVGAPEDKTVEALAGYPKVTTVTLKDGAWTGEGNLFEGDTGTFIVTGNRVIFAVPSNSEVLTFSFSTSANGDLRLTPVPQVDSGDAFIWSYKTWTKIR